MDRRKFIERGATASFFTWHNINRSLTKIMDVDLPLTDTHVHFIDLKQFTYPWLEQATSIKRPFDPQDFASASQQANIGKYIFMESGAAIEHSLAEVAWVNVLAKDDDRLSGIIARAEMQKSAKLFPAIEELMNIPLVKGIRGRINMEQLNSEAFVGEMKSLGRNHLSADLLLHPPMFQRAFEVLKRCSETSLILDHVGHPRIQKGDLDLWKKGMAKLAQLPNMYCKISGVISFAGPNWTTETLRLCVEYVIEQFGFDRVLYGGDWPNSLRFSDRYMDWASAFLEITREFSVAERAKLYNQNADIAYRL